MWAHRSPFVLELVVYHLQPHLWEEPGLLQKLYIIWAKLLILGPRAHTKEHLWVLPVVGSLLVENFSSNLSICITSLEWCSIKSISRDLINGWLLLALSCFFLQVWFWVSKAYYSPSLKWGEHAVFRCGSVRHNEYIWLQKDWHLLKMLYHNTWYRIVQCSYFSMFYVTCLREAILHIKQRLSINTNKCNVIWVHFCVTWPWSLLPARSQTCLC